MKVKAGEKVVMVAEAIFAPQPIAAATYISFESNQGIVGFFLDGSLDKLKNSKVLRFYRAVRLFEGWSSVGKI